VLIALGVVLAVAGVVLLIDFGGAGRFMIRRVTSRNLGELAPGYAASPGGFRVYATLILAVGLAVAGLGFTAKAPVVGAIMAAIGVLLFLVASIVAIVGEVRAYRALPRR
jgi:hypothetical protein